MSHFRLGFSTVWPSKSIAPTANYTRKPSIDSLPILPPLPIAEALATSEDTLVYAFHAALNNIPPFCHRERWKDYGGDRQNIECLEERKLAENLNKAADALYRAERDRRHNRAKTQTILKEAQICMGTTHEELLDLVAQVIARRNLRKATTIALGQVLHFPRKL